MNYKKIYDCIITKARSRTLSKEMYTENHHIVPRCIGGTDDGENLVLLTAREHFVCHRLLTKIYNNPKLIYAFYAMCNQRSSERNYKISSRMYEKLKSTISVLISEQNSKEGNGRFGKKWSDEHKQYMSTLISNIHALKKWGLTEEEKLKRSVNMSGANNPNFGGMSSEHKQNWYESRKKSGWIVSDDQRKKISDSTSGALNHMYGKTHTEETKDKMRIRALERPKLVCPHCGKVASKTNSQRWHFDNCKFK